MVTILDVAKECGFSKSTVSRAFTHPNDVHPRTLKAIMDAANKLGYMPNALARAMVTKRTENIGFIIYDAQKPLFSNPFYGPILESIVSATMEEGYSLFISSDEDIKQSSGEIMLRKHVDGIILASKTDIKTVQAFRNRGIPVVLLNFVLPLEEIYSVVSDDYGGVYETVTYLASRGHKNIGLLAGKFTSFIYGRRYQGYIDALSNCGLVLNENHVRMSRQSIVHSHQIALEILKSKNRPSALICTNDTLAVGALKAAGELGIKVPEELSITGYDNSYICEITTPELTSVDAGKEEMGKAAVSLLMDLIADKVPKTNMHTVSTKLVVRSSTN